MLRAEHFVLANFLVSDHYFDNYRTRTVSIQCNLLKCFGSVLHLFVNVFISIFNPFYATDLFPYPLETDISGGIERDRWYEMADQWIEYLTVPYRSKMGSAYFMAENVAYLNYNIQEKVLFVIVAILQLYYTKGRFQGSVFNVRLFPVTR